MNPLYIVCLTFAFADDSGIERIHVVSERVDKPIWAEGGRIPEPQAWAPLRTAVSDSAWSNATWEEPWDLPIFVIRILAGSIALSLFVFLRAEFQSLIH